MGPIFGSVNLTKQRKRRINFRRYISTFFINEFIVEFFKLLLMT
jgi:hypothetical protein